MKFQMPNKLVFLLSSVLLGGCAAEQTMTEQRFGESVRQMVRAQVYDSSTLSAPSEGTVESTDGAMLEGVIESYRNTEGDAGAIGNEITINVGDGQ